MASCEFDSFRRAFPGPFLVMWWEGFAPGTVPTLRVWQRRILVLSPGWAGKMSIPRAFRQNLTLGQSPPRLPIWIGVAVAVARKRPAALRSRFPCMVTKRAVAIVLRRDRTNSEPSNGRCVIRCTCHLRALSFRQSLASTRLDRSVLPFECLPPGHSIEHVGLVSRDMTMSAR